QTTLIQIVGRALRLHSSKNFSNIILPYSINEDGRDINNFIKIMAKNDCRIAKSCINKNIGGYININHTTQIQDDVDNENNVNSTFKYDMIYNSLGQELKCKLNTKNNVELWLNTFMETKKCIDLLKTLPQRDSEYDDNYKWIEHNKYYYKNRTNIMKNETIYNIWDQFVNNPPYNVYFINNNIEKWINKRDIIQQFIHSNNRLPNKNSLNKDE